MGKYKQWLHHQEVGARLRDEIATLEAERERVLKLAPNRTAALPDPSNPIIETLLGHGLPEPAPKQPVTKAASNGASSASVLEKAEIVVAEVSAATSEAASGQQASQAGQPAVQAEQREEAATNKNGAQSAKASGEEVKAPKGSTGKHKAVTAPSTRQPEKRAEPAAAASTSSQPDTIDPLLDALLARAESEPDDPLEALNALANKGSNLTRGEPPTLLGAASSVPAASSMSPGESALNALLNQSKAPTNPQIPTAEPASTSSSNGTGSGSSAQAAQSAAPAQGDKSRADTDELIAARPAEGYTEPRLAVPWWLRSVELNQDGQESEKAPATPEEAEAKQRLSVSLPFENEEDMRLHESVERWWQRWRQQS